MSKKEIMFLSIGIFLTVLAWMVADIYNAATTEKLKQKISLPTIKKYDIDPTTLQILKGKTE